MLYAAKGSKRRWFGFGLVWKLRLPTMIQTCTIEMETPFCRAAMSMSNDVAGGLYTWLHL